jgi:predicted dehydrogenase
MRALFLGLGGVGQRHLRNLRALAPDAAVAAVRRQGRSFEIRNDLSVDDSADVMAKYQVEALPDLAAACAWKPDLAIVSTPSALHVEHCLALIAAGIPVMVEKPAAVEAEGYDRLVAAATAPVMVACQMRFNPLVRRFKDLLDQGRVGTVHSVEVTVHSYMPSWHGYERPDQFYAGRADLGGGVVMTEIHELDLLGWLIGPATTVKAVGGRLGAAEIDVEDTVAAALMLDHRGRAVPAAVSLSFVQQPPARRFVVNGSLGRMTMEVPKLRLTVEDAAGRAEVEQLPDFDRNELFIAELRHFLDCIAEGSPPLTSLDSCRAGQMMAVEMLRQVRG